MSGQSEENHDQQGLPTWVVLTIMLLGGLLFRVLMGEFHDQIASTHWMLRVLGHLAELFADGLIVAAVLGIAVDTALKRRLQREVFQATLGYLLPPALRSVMVWVYSQRIICPYCRVVIVLTPTEDGEVVNMGVTITRHLRNVSGGVAPLDPILVMDTTAKADIQRFTIRRGDKTLGESDDTSDEFQDGRKMPAISLAAGEQVVAEYEWREVRRADDVYHEVWLSATIDPVVTVRAPDSLLVKVGVSTTIDTMERRELGDDLTEWSFRQAGTLLPGQGIVVRWRSKKAPSVAGQTVDAGIGAADAPGD